MRSQVTPEALRRIVAEFTADPSINDVDADRSLTGVIDSLTLVDVLARLEENYGIKFENEHLTASNWSSFSTICALVNRLLSSRGAAER